jgi:CubicO group peptidase (beta-lactamase class C family)
MPPAVAPADVPAWAERRMQMEMALPTVEAFVAGEVQKQRFPSLVTAVLVDGRLLWWRGHGVRDLEDGGEVGMTTLYRLGSVTKIVTAMALLSLREAGRVDIDGPAAMFVPELEHAVYPTAERVPITLRHLLTHTAGLPRDTMDWGRTDAPSERELLVSIRQVKLERTPGEGAWYSNIGYAILGVIVGRIAGEPFQAYVDRQILAPLGLHARWSLGDVRSSEVATGYGPGGAEVPDWNLGAAEGAGGLWGSLDDLVRLTAYHMTAWPPGGRADQPPLRNATLRESHMLGGFQAAVSGSGFGWAVGSLDGKTLVSHAGGTTRYAATVMFLPDERVGLVALASCGCERELETVAVGALRVLLGRASGRRVRRMP